MIIIRSTKYNKNTTAALLGTLETAGCYIYRDAMAISSISKEELDKIPKDAKNTFLFSFTTPHREHAYADIAALRRRFPGAVFIAGGPHASGDAGDCISNGFDEVISGEGESALEELYKSGVRGPESEIKYKNKALALTPESEVRGSDSGFKDKTKHPSAFDSGLRPARRSFSEGGIPDSGLSLDSFPPFPLKEPRYALYIEITRGCPYACSFCQTSKIFGTKPRHRSVDNILKYSEIMIKNGLADLRFVSPNSLSYGSRNGKEINMHALENLLSSLHALTKGRGRVFFGSFPSEVRPEFVNDGTMALMKKYCDNDNIIIGGQSGSDRVLKLTNRRHSSAGVETAADTALRHGFKVNVDFLFGFDFEGMDEARQSIGLMERLVKKGVKIHAHRLIPVAGTRHYGMKEVKIEPKIMEFLNKHHGKGTVYGNY